MAKLTKKQILEKEYKHQRKLLKERIKRAEKAGFSFKDVMPKEVKKVTQASIEKLKKLRGEELRSKGTYKEKEAGKEVSGKRGVYLQRREAGIKASETKRRNEKEREDFEKWKKEVYDIDELDEEQKDKKEREDFEKWKKEVYDIDELDEEQKDKKEEPPTKESEGDENKGKKKAESDDSAPTEEENIIEAFKYDIWKFIRNAKDPAGYNAILREIESALDNEDIAQTRRERAKLLGRALADELRDNPRDMRKLGYDEQMALSFFESVLKRIPNANFTTNKSDLQDAFERNENGWEFGR